MNSTDTLKIKIEESRALLPKENREAIDNVNWKLIILGIGKKYNQEQLGFLETETELLLCGILSPEEYQKELEKRLKIPKEEVASLLNEMDKNIFTKMKSELEKILAKKENVSTPTPTSSKREEIITNYQLPMTNEKEGAKTITKENMDDEVPLPPYANSSKVQVVSSRGEEIQKQNPVVINKPDEELKYIPKNIFEDKMKASTASEHKTSDHSNPKIDPYREEF